MAQLDEWNNRIKQLYHDITSKYKYSSEIIDLVTDDYCQLVLNIGEK
jgi:hypothetical protein